MTPKEDDPTPIRADTGLLDRLASFSTHAVTNSGLFSQLPSSYDHRVENASLFKLQSNNLADGGTFSLVFTWAKPSIGIDRFELWQKGYGLTTNQAQKVGEFVDSPANIVFPVTSSVVTFYLRSVTRTGLLGSLEQSPTVSVTNVPPTTAGAATAGAATLPANPQGFLVMKLDGGTQRKIPYYLT